MKGIVLAGGRGTRLYPVTRGVSKQLLPVYDKPMIYYPLSVLMLANIQDILLITTPEDQANFYNVLGDGRQFGINLSYAVQAQPKGLADAFIVGKNFIGDSHTALILGDNIFYGQGFSERLQAVSERKTGATIFGYQVKDPGRFGVVAFDKNGKVTSLEEKPEKPISNYAITGLYFYDNQVVNLAKEIKPSTRGELEIIDLIHLYLKQEQLNVELLGRGFAWLDTGTQEALLEAGQFIQTIEHRQGLKIACLEEIALLKGWLSKSDITIAGTQLKNTAYGQYLLHLVNQ